MAKHVMPWRDKPHIALLDKPEIAKLAFSMGKEAMPWYAKPHIVSLNKPQIAKLALNMESMPRLT
ncbi:unnamed protein product [Prunus armeniaca]|uniref:Uncharacterized protein n=1 Tax=Prunus armeniaca TaxID=36596 RepID=A0A6J5WGW6_PRUAR|nr:unnamed protein product [Prunus armeniaca]